MSEFVALPFGDLWCVVFAPNGQVEGICAIPASKAVADEVVLGIASVYANVTGVNVRLTKVVPNSPAHVMPCVIFERPFSDGPTVFDWLGSDSKAECRRVPDPANYFPTVDATSVPRGSKAVPMSLGDLQDLLSTQTVELPNLAGILQELEKHYYRGVTKPTTFADEELARAIESRLSKSRKSILEALKDVARDDSVKGNLRKTAIACAVTFDDPDQSAFLAEFVIGKNPAALYAAYENGNSSAGEEYGLFREAKSHLNELGHTFTHRAPGESPRPVEWVPRAEAVPSSETIGPTKARKQEKGAPHSMSIWRKLFGAKDSGHESGQPMSQLPPPTLAVIVSRIDQTTARVFVFKDGKRKALIPAWDDFEKFQSWSDAGGKAIMKARNIPNMLVMAYDRERLIAELKPFAPIDVHFCPPAGHLEGPPERTFRLE